MLLQITGLLFVVCVALVQGLRVDISDKHPLDEPTITELNGLPPPSLQNKQCDQKLGMESGDISDDQITVSSSLSPYGKEHARLNGDSVWVTHASKEAWIQVENNTVHIYLWLSVTSYIVINCFMRLSH